MENFEKFDSKKQEKRKEKGMTRREFLKALGLGIAGASGLCSGLEKAIAWDLLEKPSRYEKHRWFYTLEEMRDVYKREYQGEKILQNIVRRKDGQWLATVNGKEFFVPQEFFDKTLKHLKDIIEQKTAKFLFRLDAFHGHFFIPDDKYSEHYAFLNDVEQARTLVKDKNLGILFHNSEHLKPDENNPEEMELYKKRNVIGWYDGRPLEILPFPEGKRKAAEEPGRGLIPYLRFAGHKDGEFSLIVDGEEIRLDFSFDDSTYY